MNCSIHPVILKIWEYRETRWSYHFSSMMVLRKDGITPFLFSLMISTSSNWISVFGKSSSFHSNQEGQSHHLELNKAFPEHPQDGRLAGLRSSGMCLHPSFIVRLRITFTQLLTKVPQSLDMKTELDRKSCGLSTKYSFTWQSNYVLPKVSCHRVGHLRLYPTRNLGWVWVHLICYHFAVQYVPSHEDKTKH